VTISVQCGGPPLPRRRKIRLHPVDQVSLTGDGIAHLRKVPHDISNVTGLPDERGFESFNRRAQLNDCRELRARQPQMHAGDCALTVPNCEARLCQVAGDGPDIERKAGHVPIDTFDRNLSKLDGAKRLE